MFEVWEFCPTTVLFLDGSSKSLHLFFLKVSWYALLRWNTLIPNCKLDIYDTSWGRETSCKQSHSKQMHVSKEQISKLDMPSWLDLLYYFSNTKSFAPHSSSFHSIRLKQYWFSSAKLCLMLSPSNTPPTSRWLLIEGLFPLWKKLQSCHDTCISFSAGQLLFWGNQNWDWESSVVK